MVIVEKSGGNRPAAPCCSCFRSYIRKGSIAVVVIQNILPITSDIEIGITVVIIVAHGHSHSVISIPGIRQSRLLSYIGKASVLVLTVEAIPVTRVMTVKVVRRWRRSGQAAPVHEKDVQQSIIVIVEQRNASGHGFDQMLLRSGGILQRKINSLRQLHFK